MKKSVKTVFLLLLLALSLVLTSCGEYSPAKGGDQKNPSQDAGGNGGGDDTVDEKDLFTVSLSYNGAPYVPSADTPISVQWNDGFSVHKADMEQGVAKVGGLDGDYQVTLSAVPEGYAYDPSAYIATNTNRNLVIELYKITEGSGKGTELYKSISIKYTGVYCVDITSAEQEVFYEFAPSKSGTYSVESWANTTENTINPMANYYGANAFFKQFDHTCNDGGTESSYTKNFNLQVKIADEQISDSGQVTFTFGIKATSKTGEYPVRVYFAVKLDGEFSLNHIQSNIIVPKETLVRQPEYPGYTLVGAEFPVTQNGNTANVFDGDNYRYWAREEGGDGYYHLFNLEQYPDTQGYGPILYAYISAPCRFVDSSFHQVEYRGNKALTVSKGTENYKLFIEGFDELTFSHGDLGPYFCIMDCPCRADGCPGACAIGCTKCHADCRQCPEEGIGHGGYANYTNSDGVYGVTQELKDFLQKYSVNQRLFFDGNGFVETNPSVSVYAEEDDQWLFACGYYVKN